MCRAWATAAAAAAAAPGRAAAPAAAAIAAPAGCTPFCFVTPAKNNRLTLLQLLKLNLKTIQGKKEEAQPTYTVDTTPALPFCSSKIVKVSADQKHRSQQSMLTTHLGCRHHHCICLRLLRSPSCHRMREPQHRTGSQQPRHLPMLSQAGLQAHCVAQPSTHTLKPGLHMQPMLRNAAAGQTRLITGFLSCCTGHTASWP